jgi:adenylate kinase
VDADAVRERLGQRHRGDDLQGVIDHRLDVFLQQTAPLISYYQAHDKLKLIDGAQPPEAVAASIDEVIRSLAEPSFGEASFGHKPNVSQVVPGENTKENGSNA